MKKILLALALTACVFVTGYTQSRIITKPLSETKTPPRDWGVSFKALFMDYQSQNGGSFTRFKDYHRGFEVNIQRKLTDKLSLVVPFKLGVVNDTTIIEDEDYLRKTVYGLDLQAHYGFQTEGFLAQPYILAGVGGVQEKVGEFNIQIPIGGGVKIPVFNQHAYVNYQVEYRHGLTKGRSNLHHGIGFVYMLGKDDMMDDKDMGSIKDSDGDGVEDSVDLCPDVPGLPEYNGCPDSDGDGIPDYQDLCPLSKGPASTRGCPDSDGDGVPDHEDECPNVPGTKANKGCPETPTGDRDGDGILDSIDKCPDQAGPLRNEGCPEDVDTDGDGIPDSRDKCPNIPGTEKYNGCPEPKAVLDSDGDGIPDSEDECPNKPGPRVYNGCPDSDGDGIHDGRDKCPNSRGSVATNGCPEVTKEDRQTLDIAMRAVQFDTGSNRLRAESYDILGKVTNILNRYPDYNLVIEGHTDNTGSASNNQRLSEKRAKACKTYLVKKGIDSRRISHAGYGESRPVADNNTLRGRTLNRRVEFRMVAPR